MSKSKQLKKASTVWINLAVIALGLTCSLILAAVFRLDHHQPSPEEVFYNTLEGNLKTNAIGQRTTISHHDGQRTTDVYQSDLSLNFKAQTQAQFNQRILIFDRLMVAGLAEDNQELGQYLDDQSLNQEWYNLETKNFNNDVYFKRAISEKNLAIDHPEQVNRNVPSTDHHNYYKSSLDDGPDSCPAAGAANRGNNLNGDYYRFLITASSSFTGFLFGNLDPDDRVLVMNELKQAYLVNFDQTKRYSEKGRLIYEYDFVLNQTAFVKAFISYLNYHYLCWDKIEVIANDFVLPDGQRIPIRNLANPNLVNLYTAKIDVVDNRLLEVSQPLNDDQGLRDGYQGLSFYSSTSQRYDKIAQGQVSVQPYNAAFPFIYPADGYYGRFTARTVFYNQGVIPKIDFPRDYLNL